MDNISLVQKNANKMIGWQLHHPYITAQVDSQMLTIFKSYK